MSRVNSGFCYGGPLHGKAKAVRGDTLFVYKQPEYDFLASMSTITDKPYNEPECWYKWNKALKEWIYQGSAK